MTKMTRMRREKANEEMAGKEHIRRKRKKERKKERKKVRKKEKKQASKQAR